jgi:hypothetical protein
MCQINKETETLKEPMTVYKVAPGGRSEWSPTVRASIPDFPATKGRTLKYPIGKKVRSPSGPGIFAYPAKDTAITFYFWLELRIPKGAKIRRGTLHGTDIITASSVYVIRELP